MKLYVTKHALTTGVRLCEAEIDAGYPNVATVQWPIDGRTIGVSVVGLDWHRDIDSATAQVRKMIDAKRKSLLKQGAKLEDLEAKIMLHGLPVKE